MCSSPLIHPIAARESRTSCYNEAVAEETPAPVAFEAALDELDAVVKKLEAGDLPLEESLKLYERGMELSEVCRKQLDEAEHRVEVLVRRGEKMRPEPFPSDNRS